MNLFTALRTPRTALKPRIELTPVQVALILALQPVCRAAGLWIVCTRCAKEYGTYKHLETDNQLTDAVWKVDCPCTERRFTKAELPTMHPSGDLLLMMDRVWAGTHLALRCPNKVTWCLTTPLDVTPDLEGVTARCQCWQIDLKAGVYRFKKHAPAMA